jgi:predicted acetyltransferase
MDLRLVAASLDVPDGLEDVLREVGRGEAGFGGTDYEPARETLSDFLHRLIDRGDGRNLPPGWVPDTTYWLLDDAGAVVGISRLRHELNDELLHHGGHIGYYVRPAARGKGCGTAILALTLAEGRELGIERFLLTVSSDNEPSIRVIEGNGGVLEDERRDSQTGLPFRRYWIERK